MLAALNITAENKMNKFDKLYLNFIPPCGKIRFRPENLGVFNVKTDYYDDIEVVDVSRKLILSTSERFVMVPSCSLEFIRSGEVMLKQGEKNLHLRGPVVTWIPPSTPLKFINSSGELYDHLWIDFKGARAERIVNSFVSGVPEGFIKVSGNCVKQLEAGFMSMINDFHSNRHLYHGRIVNTLENLVWELHCALSPLPESAAADKYHIKDLAKAISLNPFAERNIRQMAENCGISYIHFRRIFREVTGFPVAEYINRQKILYAANLLSSGGCTVKEAALTCKFKDLSAFSRMFKKYMEKSPRTFCMQTANVPLRQQSGGTGRGRAAN